MGTWYLTDENPCRWTFESIHGRDLEEYYRAQLEREKRLRRWDMKTERYLLRIFQEQRTRTKTERAQVTSLPSRTEIRIIIKPAARAIHLHRKIALSDKLSLIFGVGAVSQAPHIPWDIEAGNSCIQHIKDGPPTDPLKLST